MDELRKKLTLLEHKKKMMSMDRSVSEEKINEVDKLIKEVKKEITKFMYEERIQNGKRH